MDINEYFITFLLTYNQMVRLHFNQFQKDFLSNILSFKKTPVYLCTLNERFLDTYKTEQ